MKMKLLLFILLLFDYYIKYISNTILNYNYSSSLNSSFLFINSSFNSLNSSLSFVNSNSLNSSSNFSFISTNSSSIFTNSSSFSHSFSYNFNSSFFFNLSSYFNFNNNFDNDFCLKYSEQEICELQSSQLCLNCLNITKKRKEKNIELDLLLNKYPQCKTGFSRKGHIASINEKIEDKCINRGFDNRTSLKRTWKNLPLKYTHSSIDLIFTAFNSFSSKTDIVDIVFLGDSVSTQLSQFLICDLLRLKIPSSTPFHTHVESFNHTTTEFKFLPLHLNNYLQNKTVINHSLFSHKHRMRTFKSLRIHNKQFNIPCVNLQNSADCRENIKTINGKEKMTNYVTNYTKTLLQYFLDTTNLDKNIKSKKHLNDLYMGWNKYEKNSSTREIYIIVNYGLHIKKGHRHWGIEGLIKAIYQQQKESLLDQLTNKIVGVKSNIFWRETSAQAFAYSQDGSYEWDKSNVKINGFCCQPPSIDPHIHDWKAQDVLNILNELDFNWSKYIGWIPFYNFSIILSDLRIEYDYKNNIFDCTHFIYSPIAYELLWWDMSIAINNLKNISQNNNQQNEEIY